MKEDQLINIKNYLLLKCHENNNKQLDSFYNIEKYYIFKRKIKVDSYFNKVKIINDDVCELYNINEYIDNIFCNKLNSKYYNKYPILQFEYNLDYKRKSLNELFLDMKVLISFIKNDKSISNVDKYKILNITKGIYYELFCKKLKFSNNIELNNFIDNNDLNLVTNFFKDMQLYFRSERIRKSLISLENYNKNKLKYSKKEHIFNNGYVLINNNGKKLLVDVNKYSKDLVKYSKTLSKYIPSNGYYILKNGGKVYSIDYLNKLIRDYSFNGKNNNILELLINGVKSTIETDYLINIEEINRTNQKQIALLNNSLKYFNNRKTKNIIKRLWEKKVKGKFNKYNLKNLSVKQIEIDDD